MSPARRGVQYDSPKFRDADRAAALVEITVGCDGRRERAVGEAALADATGRSR
jgi:hypothetical protein